MKLTMTIVCLFALVLFAASCGDSKSDTQNAADHAAADQSADHPAGESEHPTGEEHPKGDDHPTGSEHPTGATELTLNDGQKWQMDDNTRTALKTMTAAFATVDVSALDAVTLKAAGVSLKKNIDEMIHACTMTGADHDQLHVYLSGLTPAVNALGEKGQVADAKEVQKQLAIYGDYFE